MNRHRNSLLRRTLVVTASLTLGLGGARAGSLRFGVSGVSLSRADLSQQGAVDLSYTLSGSGFGVPGALRNVTVEFLKDGAAVKTLTLRPGDPGALPGANTVVIRPADAPAPGVYTVRISVAGADFTAPDYAEVSAAGNPDLQFASPRGVDVNRVAGSPYAGRIYVSEGAAGTMANRSTQEGVYVLNPDLSPAFAGPRATNSTIGSLGPWASSANSPFRVVVAGDGRVLLTDASDAHSGLFVADPDVNNLTPLFAYPAPSGGTRDTSGRVADRSGNAVYGSTSSAWIESAGTGETVYTTDEDLTPGNSLWKRTIPAGATNTAVVPTLAAGISGANWIQDFVRDSAGASYVVSLTTNDAGKYDAAGNRVATLPANGVGYYGIAMDEPRGRLFLAANDGHIFQADPEFSDSAAVIGYLGADVRDVAVDGEGWIYAADETDHRLRVFAAAGDYSVAGSSATAAQTLTVLPPTVPGDIAPLGPAGLYVGEHGGRYGDAKVDVSDAITLMRIATGLDSLP